MDDWTKIIIYGLIIYFVYKANSQFAELKGEQVFKRPSNWSWITWQIYLFKNALKPKSIDMPLGMWLVVCIYGFGIIGFIIFDSTNLFGVDPSTRLQRLGGTVLSVLAIFFIYKKMLAGFYIAIVVAFLDIISSVRLFKSPPPVIDLSVADLIRSLIIPVLILIYMMKNKEYFKKVTS